MIGESLIGLRGRRRHDRHCRRRNRGGRHNDVRQRVGRSAEGRIRQHIDRRLGAIVGRRIIHQGCVQPDLFQRLLELHLQRRIVRLDRQRYGKFRRLSLVVSQIILYRLQVPDRGIRRCGFRMLRVRLGRRRRLAFTQTMRLGISFDQIRLKNSALLVERKSLLRTVGLKLQGFDEEPQSAHVLGDLLEFLQCRGRVRFRETLDRCLCMPNRAHRVVLIEDR